MLRHGLALASLLALPTVHSVSTEECPLLGPVHSSGFDITATEAFQNATASFPDQIEALFEAGEVNRTDSSFSIDVFSTVTNESIYSYYHIGEAHSDYPSTGVIDDGTLMRIGSVSKLYTVYAIIVKAGIDVLGHPVTKYLPELAGNAQNRSVEKIIWEDVTVGALASQQAGVGGFEVEIAGCFGNDPPTCSDEDFLTSMRDSKHAVTPVFANAIYHDSGFGILGQVLQRLTGLTYDEAIQEALAKPLGLSYTSSFKPKTDDFNGFVVPGDISVSAWGYDNQIVAGSGGIYSSPHDLRKTGLSILNSKLLSPHNTRHWMKPLSHTASLATSVGAPWEIERLPITLHPNTNRTRISDLYTKLGGQSGYGAVFALSPDHQIGYSILVAGPLAGSERFTLRNTVGEVFLTAAEHGAVENSEINYTGTFVDEAAQGTNLTIKIDDGRPGLGLDSMYVDGVPYRTNLVFPPGAFSEDGITARFYPVGQEMVTGARSKEVSYRIIVSRSTSRSPRSDADGGNGGMFNGACLTNFSTGFMPNIDEFVFEVVDGRLESVRYPELGITMTRVA